MAAIDQFKGGSVKNYLFAIAALALSGCATPVTHNTASGRPEATFQKSLVDTHNVILNASINRGYQITRDSPNLIVADRPSKNAIANMMLGSQANPIVNARLTFTMISTMPNQTRVVVDMAAITNPGTGFESSLAGNDGADSNVIQSWLTGLTAQ